MNRQQSIRTARHPRGLIIDARGRLLAGDYLGSSLYVDPRYLEDQDDAIARLSQVLHIDGARLAERVSKGRSFVWVKRHVDGEQRAAALNLQIQGLYTFPELQRSYPNGLSGCHFIGFAGIDSQGLEGLEFSLHSRLAPHIYYERITTDAFGRSISLGGQLRTAPPAVMDAQVTIDMGAQWLLERALQQVVDQDAGGAGAAIALDASTGEVYGMASLPGYDPNTFQQFDAHCRINHAVSDVFDPGDMLLPLAGAILLDRMPDPEIVVDGGQSSDGQGTRRLVANLLQSKALEPPSGSLRPKDIERLVDGLSAFGFGTGTGIELPGEAEGNFSLCSPVSHDPEPEAPLGFTLRCSLLQLASAYGAIANQGCRVPPSILHSLRGRDGSPPKVFHRTDRVQAVSAEAAIALTEMMPVEEVAFHNTAWGAGVLRFPFFLGEMTAVDGASGTQTPCRCLIGVVQEGRRRLVVVYCLIGFSSADAADSDLKRAVRDGVDSRWVREWLADREG